MDLFKEKVTAPNAEVDKVNTDSTSTDDVSVVTTLNNNDSNYKAALYHKRNSIQIKAFSLEDTAIYSYIRETLDKCKGFYSVDSIVVNEAIAKIKKRIDELKQNPSMIKPINVVNSTKKRIPDCMFVDGVLTKSQKRVISENVYLEPELNDNGDDVLYITTVNSETNGVVSFTDNSCYFNEIGCKEKKAVKSVEILRRNFAAALETLILIRGFILDGIVYHYLCTTAGGLKEGRHYYIDDETLSNFNATLSEIRRLGKLSSGYNSFKDSQYLSLLFTDASRMKLSVEFLKKLIIIDIGKIKDNGEISSNFPLLYSTVTPEKMIDIEKPVDTNKTGVVDFNPKMVSDKSYVQINSDGHVSFNNDCMTDEEKLLYANKAFQGRAFGCKYFAQAYSFTRMAEKAGLTDEQCKITDIFGNVHDIRKVSGILDANSFKYYKLLLADTDKYKSYYDFSHAMGFDALYVKSIYGDDVKARLVKFTKQAFQSMNVGAEDIEKLSETRIADIRKIDNASTEELIDIATKLYGEEQSVRFVLNKNIDSGNFVYGKEVLEKIENYRYSIISEALNSFLVDGQMLKYVPDLPRYFCALCNVKCSGFCGDEDAIYAKALPNGEVIVERSPIVAFDLWLGLNTANAPVANKFAEFALSSVMYHGWNSTVLKRTAGDDDGDTGAVFNNKTIINMYKKTLKYFDFHMVNFFSVDGSDITDENLSSFEDTDWQRGYTIATAQMLNKVGSTSGKLANAFCEITSVMYDAFSLPDGENEKLIKKVNDMYLHDIAPLAQLNQLYVDAQKRGFAFDWTCNQSILGEEWYMKKKNWIMPHKAFTLYDKASKVYKGEEKLVCFEDSGKIDASASYDNYGRLFNYIFSTVDAYRFHTTEIFNVEVDDASTFKFGFGVNRYFTSATKELRKNHQANLDIFLKEEDDFAKGDYLVPYADFTRKVFEERGIILKEETPGFVSRNDICNRIVTGIIRDKSGKSGDTLTQKYNLAREIYMAQGGSAFYRALARAFKTAINVVGKDSNDNRMNLVDFLSICTRKVGNTFVCDAATYAEYGEIKEDSFVVNSIEFAW